MKVVRRLRCRLFGHAAKMERFTSRGRRFEITQCARCGHIDLLAVKPWNRKARRAWARKTARELAR